MFQTYQRCELNYIVEEVPKQNWNRYFSTEAGMAKERLPIHAVILAGGRGTRFWPRSRTRTPKQLLNIIGKTTMLQQTVERLRALISPENVWTVTNSEQAAAVRKQLPAASGKRVLTEPV